MSLSDADVLGAEIDVVVVSGKDLAPKDSSFFGKGTSDPYVKVEVARNSTVLAKLGQTKVVEKSLSPSWGESFKGMLSKQQLQQPGIEVVFLIYDWDFASGDDPMGQVRIPLEQLASGHLLEKSLPVQDVQGCSKASGELKVQASLLLRRIVSLERGGVHPLPGGTIGVALGWDPLPGNVAVDLDNACVALSGRGDVIMKECVYFGQLKNSNGSIRHSGDEREGDENLHGSGDDEMIMVDLNNVPREVFAMFFVAAVATEGETFRSVKSARVRVVDWATGVESFRFCPAELGAHTSMVSVRILRASTGGWVMNVISQADHTARDFGSLIPEIKGLMLDVIPGVKVDQNERVALMRKGGNVRIRDFCPQQGGGAGCDENPLTVDTRAIPQRLCLGLAWDVTGGCNVDLDASVILMDAAGEVIEVVYYGHLKSHTCPGAVVHGGDEREGDEKGDDERVFLQLQLLPPTVCYLGICITSYSGQELDDVKDASCHLFNPLTNMDIVNFKMSKTKELDKKTGVLIGTLYRDQQNPSE
eukprot:gene10328-12214_t